ncbi:CoA transferase [Cucumibacter marinus]|uniref:CoA transferase n=1 Tax=Cucumibacter marinus TaxID=1121252 RepID=UPI00040C4F08|nr:CoA transferase [Cucumibacter marinus]
MLHATNYTLLEAPTPDCPLPLRVAMAMTGRIAADLGANVLRVEGGCGDPLRSVGAQGNDDGALFSFLSARKSTLHMAEVSGSALMAIAADTDAVITNKGLGGEALALPSDIVVELSCFANDDARKASEFTVAALAGLLSMVGDPDRQPLRLAGHQPAYALGLSAFLGLSSALFGREFGERAGQREVVRANLMDTIVWLNWKAIPMPGTDAEPLMRAGTSGEWQVVRCADGYVAIVYQEADWERLCKALNDPRLSDPALALRADRLRASKRVAALIEDNFTDMSRADIRRMALDHRLPLGPVWSPEELFDDPQCTERDFFAAAQIGSARVPGLPLLMNGKRPGPDTVDAAIIGRATR